eukprot:PhM_4_TR9401/c0_g1_i1/m.70300
MGRHSHVVRLVGWWCLCFFLIVILLFHRFQIGELYRVNSQLQATVSHEVASLRYRLQSTNVRVLRLEKALVSSDAASSAKPLPRIAILTMNVAFGSDWIYPLSFRNKIAYAQEHGYDLIVEGPELVDTSRHVCWSKIPMLERWLPYYDWIMWMDGDAFFTDFSIRLESFLPTATSASASSSSSSSSNPAPHQTDLVVGKDWNGINLGVFFIRNSEYSYRLLSEMWAMPRDHWHPWEEQSALMFMTSVEKNPRDARRHLEHISIRPQKQFNAYPEEFTYGNGPAATWTHGDFIVHFPSCKNIPSCRSVIQSFYAFVRKRDDTVLPTIPAVFYPSWHEKAREVEQQPLL